MITTHDVQQLLAAGGTVIGRSGDQLGKIGQIFLDDHTGEPAWVTVSTGLFGTSESFVPLNEATVTGTEITVPHDKATVKDAPRVNQDSDGHLSETEEAELYRYYGMSSHDTGSPETRTDTDASAPGTGTPAAGTPEAELTRSEERLKVGTEAVPTGKARLRKYIVTEQQTVTVPVTREEVRLEREPITEPVEGAAAVGAKLTEDEAEVTLHAERVVVEKDVVPVERVKVTKETATEDRQVTEDIRKEQIDHTVDTDSGRALPDGEIGPR